MPELETLLFPILLSQEIKLMKQTDKADKKPYASPTVTVLGDIEAITLAFNTGTHLDADFPAGTFLGDLGLS